MKKTVKSPVLLTILLLSFYSLPAQIKLPVLSSNGIGADMKKILAGVPNHFEDLMGEIISETPQSTDYACNITVNGAEESSVTRYASSKKMVCSWQSVMLTTDDFQKAKQKYHSLFSQLNNLEAMIGGKKYHLKGDWEAPAGDKKFYSLSLKALPGDEALKKLRVEVLILFNEPMEWKVKLMVYEQEKEDADEQ